MTTQSNSSRDEMPRAVRNGMSLAEYDTWMFLADKEALDEPYTYKINQSDITALINAEVRQALDKLEAQSVELPMSSGENIQLVPLSAINQLRSEYE